MFVLKNTPKYPAGQRRNSKGIGKYLEMKIKLKYNIAKLMQTKLWGKFIACVKKEKYAELSGTTLFLEGRLITSLCVSCFFTHHLGVVVTSFKPTDYFFVTFFDPPLNCFRSREERRFLSYRITPSCT